MRMIILLASVLAFASATHAQFLYQEGKHYAPLPVPVTTADPNTVEVVEVFAYGCIHCYRFEPLLADWKKTLPEGVTFVALPAVFNHNNMMMQAQAFYTAETLGVFDTMHPAMFAAIHEQGNGLQTKESIAALFKSVAGVDEAEFDKVFSSFGITSRARQSAARMRDYRISGTPSMVVNGKYLVSGKGLSGQDEMLKVVNYLVTQELQALRAKAAADQALSALPAEEAAETEAAEVPAE